MDNQHTQTNDTQDDTELITCQRKENQAINQQFKPKPGGNKGRRKEEHRKETNRRTTNQTTKETKLNTNTNKNKLLCFVANVQRKLIELEPSARVSATWVNVHEHSRQKAKALKLTLLRVFTKPCCTTVQRQHGSSIKKQHGTNGTTRNSTVTKARKLFILQVN